MGAPPPPPGGPYEEPQPWSPPPFGTTAPPLAGRWRRLFAGIVDGVIVAIISSPFTYDSLRVVSNPATGPQATGRVGDALAAGVIGFLYFWLLQSLWRGQTIGKKLFGMRVARATGGPATSGQIALRQFVEVVLGWLCFLGLVNLAWILFDRRKQALHDKAARTVVVDA
ncbi:RDD family protein [Microbispora sp. NPDC049125]|uniref:RDD family protein n=1 Tax=Microbispora sp. NPDC049125 TaxID=3154929 RepID=UPI0034654750